MRGASALETGVLYCDDNLARMRTLPDESVDLIYLDPPFFSNRVYEIIWGDEAEVRSFEDRWEGGIQLYVGWMRDRMIEIWRLLKPTGSLYLHCDPHASHYLKVMMDEVCGGSSFRSEVIWKRTNSHNSARRWGPQHDTILFYTKGEKYTWNKLFQAYDASYVSNKFTQQDSRGLFQPVSLTGPGKRRGDSGLPWRGVDPTDGGRHWQPPTMLYDYYTELTGQSLAHLSMQERLDHADAAGLIYWPTKRDGLPRFKQYLHISPGVPLQDIILDIDALNSRAAERLGYPTQKPEALLERIILASSNKGDVILDPFCGCGTTVTVAEKTEREWVGIDISPTAVNIMDRRIKRIPGAQSPKLIGLPSTVESLRKLNHFEFQNWVIQQFYGVGSPRKTGDMGIDGYTFLTRDPIQVKQSERVGRNVVDNFETAVRRDRSSTGWIVAFSFTRGAYEEAARARWHDKLDIKLVTVDELLKPKALRKGPLWPEPATVTEIPLAAPRDPSEYTSEELIASARRGRARTA